MPSKIIDGIWYICTSRKCPVKKHRYMGKFCQVCKFSAKTNIPPDKRESLGGLVEIVDRKKEVKK